MNLIRVIVSNLLPAKLKRRIKLFLRYWKDSFNGSRRKFSTRRKKTYLNSFIVIEQEIRTTNSSANKLHNIAIAVNQLDGLLISPGEIFSFWHIVGSPVGQHGYKKSRSIVNGKLEAETGGGLCQLSGLIYFLALRSGLSIIERHAHSIDIYTEEERFTPLGSDATVAYGYKDLRVQNDLEHPVQLRFNVSDTKLTGMLCCDGKLHSRPIDFQYNYQNGSTEVTTLSGNVILFTNIYKKNKVGG